MKMKHMCTATKQFLSVYCIRNIFAILRIKTANLRSVSFLSGPQKHKRVVVVSIVTVESRVKGMYKALTPKNDE